MQPFTPRKTVPSSRRRGVPAAIDKRIVHCEYGVGCLLLLIKGAFNCSMCRATARFCHAGRCPRPWPPTLFVVCRLVNLQSTNTVSSP